MSRRALALLCAIACVFAGCERRPAPTVSKEGGTGASGPGSSASTTQQLPEPKKLADLLVPEGSAGNDGFTLEFHVRRDEGDAGKTYDQAVASCRKSGRMLCTETQWMRACTEHPAIGEMESWTASRRGRTAVVRGGKDCQRRNKVDGGESNPRRVGLCCERAVALRPSGDAGPWLGTGARFPLQLEKALNAGDDDALRSLFAKQVVREGKEWTVDALLANEKEARGGIRWTVFDFCHLRSGPVIVDKDGVRTGRHQGLILNCRTILARDDDVVDYYTRFGLVQSGDDKEYRVAQIEHKSAAVIPGAR